MEQTIKRAVHSFTRGACFECSGGGVFASNHSNAISALEVREHLKLLTPYDLGECMLVLRRVEGAPETLISVSDHSSTSFSLGECSLETWFLGKHAPDGSLNRFEKCV